MLKVKPILFESAFFISWYSNIFILRQQLNLFCLILFYKSGIPLFCGK